jgi:hypothetical protein
VVHLDGREPEPSEARRRAGVADEPRKVVACGPVPVATEVDPREDDLSVTLGDPAADLGEHGLRRPAARGTADLRDHAEGAGEAAPVLDLDESPDAVEPEARLDATNRAYVAGDGIRRPLARERNDRDVGGKTVEGAAEVRRASCHVDAAGSRREAPGCLPRFLDRLVRHAACAEHGHVRRAASLAVAVGEQALAELLRVRVRDLAA